LSKNNLKDNLPKIIDEKHVGVHPGPNAVGAFQDELKEYKTFKGTIQFLMIRKYQRI
jgi:uncharacterized protein YdhG (YjbR/CyaY superfamily)